MNAPLLRAGVAVIVIMIGMLASSCAVTTEGRGRPETATFEISGDTLDLRSDFGSLEVVGVPAADGPEREIRVTRWFEAEKVVGAARAEWSKEGEDTIRLSGVCSGVIIECRLRHRVEVPANVGLKIAADSGSVRAAKITAPLEIAVSEGNINLDRVSGPLTLSTTNGSMRAEHLASERVEAKASEGYVILEFDRAPTTVKTRSTRGNTTVRLPDDGYRIDADLKRSKARVAVAERKDSERRIRARVVDARLRIEPN